MANHHPASARTPGGAVNPQRDRVVRKSNFPVYPLLAVGGSCSIAVLAFHQPERSREPDAGRPAMASDKRTDRHASDAAPVRALDRALMLGNGSEREGPIWHQQGI